MQTPWRFILGIPRNILVATVLLYRWGVSPMLGANCRFAPSCSAYAVEAIRMHGALRGGWMAARRVMRCHPLGGGGYDPVPAGARAAGGGARSREGGRDG